jgi:hypothetical protein
LIWFQTFQIKTEILLSPHVVRRAKGGYRHEKVPSDSSGFVNLPQRFLLVRRSILARVRAVSALVWVTQTMAGVTVIGATAMLSIAMTAA